MVISLILIALAAICNAVMDKIAHHDYFRAYKKMPRWWHFKAHEDKYTWGWVDNQGKRVWGKTGRVKWKIKIPVIKIVKKNERNI